MTSPQDDPNNPNRSPFTPQVHQERKLSSTTGLLQDAQRGMRGKLVESIMQLVTQAITGVILPGPFGSAFTQLGQWAHSLSQNILGPLVSVLITVLDAIPIIGPPLGNALEDLANLFGLMKSNTDKAQSTGEAAQVAADNANVSIARLEGKDASSAVPGGKYFSDTYDRTSTSSLGSDYDQGSSGAPTGALQTDGNNAWWNVGGSGQGTRFARCTMDLFTIYQGVQIVINKKIPNLNLVDPHVRIVVRCNAARTSYVYVDLQYNSIQVFKVISGSTTSLGSAVSFPNPGADGDRWTFKAGTDISDDEFVVYQNTAEALRVTDSGTLAGKGAGYEYFGFVLINGQIQVGFGNTVQDPPKIQSLTGYDRLAAA